tara:strand:+ start:308 stop:556 length:249 start_codon:yes stop_codon:yes gene_type:complete
MPKKTPAKKTKKYQRTSYVTYTKATRDRPPMLNKSYVLNFQCKELEVIKALDKITKKQEFDNRSQAIRFIIKSWLRNEGLIK